MFYKINDFSTLCKFVEENNIFYLYPSQSSLNSKYSLKVGINLCYLSAFCSPLVVNLRVLL